MDRRIQRTRRLLRDALMQLILERGYDSLTVQDITDQANLGRATFYLHYKDKEELLISSMTETVDELIKELDLSPQNLLTGARPPSLIMFEHAQGNNSLYRVLLTANGMGRLVSKLRNHLAQVIRPAIEGMIDALDIKTLAVPVEIIVQHVAGSQLAMLTWWLEQGMPYSPEEMAGIMRKLSAEPMLYVLSKR
jgi:AcrR family transcriptional regulator